MQVQISIFTLIIPIAGTSKIFEWTSKDEKRIRTIVYLPTFLRGGGEEGTDFQKNGILMDEGDGENPGESFT